ncbi:uncharacterized protein ASCRUDRAFT_74868 [Ascoidea rubescens DSM 1968]|uniref:STB6-like N-terminal domain-containing protein n=1 Tax=Ascoidea rubescens DSM 1968 TaxID=1344418 RepID=A0A1D2VLP0_9ASCO|nr:hypothetical protein ASCRUDRAFT_74868 [Ascoidea rubescens DSM 1968]ODV62505.1 hypothetical protein ASCRUDRAFT_74868 [Ascoidea rubescens DSM 1968]
MFSFSSIDNDTQNDLQRNIEKAKDKDKDNSYTKDTKDDNIKLSIPSDIPSINEDDYVSIIFPDINAFNYFKNELSDLSKNYSFFINHYELQIQGFESYLIEQWLYYRKIGTLITTYTGNPNDKIISIFVKFNKRLLKLSKNLTNYINELKQFQITKKFNYNNLAYLYIANLSFFFNDDNNLNLNLLKINNNLINSKDLFLIYNQFITNFNLKKLSCGSRSALIHNNPSSASILKFNQMFKINNNTNTKSSENELNNSINTSNPTSNDHTPINNNNYITHLQNNKNLNKNNKTITIDKSVRLLIFFLKISLYYLQLLPSIYIQDSLICEKTELAIKNWWNLFGSVYFKNELIKKKLNYQKIISNQINYQLSIPAILSFTINIYLRLFVLISKSNDNKFLKKDPFDVLNFINIIYQFQKIHKLPQTNYLDNDTIINIISLSNSKFNNDIKFKKFLKNHIVSSKLNLNYIDLTKKNLSKLKNNISTSNNSMQLPSNSDFKPFQPPNIKISTVTSLIINSPPNSSITSNSIPINNNLSPSNISPSNIQPSSDSNSLLNNNSNNNISINTFPSPNISPSHNHSKSSSSLNLSLSIKNDKTKSDKSKSESKSFSNFCLNDLNSFDDLVFLDINKFLYIIQGKRLKHLWYGAGSDYDFDSSVFNQVETIFFTLPANNTINQNEKSNLNSSSNQYNIHLNHHQHHHHFNNSVPNEINHNPSSSYSEGISNLNSIKSKGKKLIKEKFHNRAKSTALDINYNQTYYDDCEYCNESLVNDLKVDKNDCNVSISSEINNSNSDEDKSSKNDIRIIKIGLDDKGNNKSESKNEAKNESPSESEYENEQATYTKLEDEINKDFVIELTRRSSFPFIRREINAIQIEYDHAYINKLLFKRKRTNNENDTSDIKSFSEIEENLKVNQWDYPFDSSIEFISRLAIQNKINNLELSNKYHNEFKRFELKLNDLYLKCTSRFLELTELIKSLNSDIDLNLKLNNNKFLKKLNEIETLYAKLKYEYRVLKIRLRDLDVSTNELDNKIEYLENRLARAKLTYLGIVKEVSKDNRSKADRTYENLLLDIQQFISDYGFSIPVDELNCLDTSLIDKTVNDPKFLQSCTLRTNEILKHLGDAEQNKSITPVPSSDANEQEKTAQINGYFSYITNFFIQIKKRCHLIKKK